MTTDLAGDVLVNRVNSIDLVGKAGLVPDDLGQATFESKNIRIRIIRDKCSARFLAYFMNTGLYLRQIRSTIKPAIAQATINQDDLDRIQVPLPALVEQERITSILSIVDDAIQKTDEIIAKTRQLKKSLMQQMLTKGVGHTKFKQTEIGVIPEEWDVVRLSQIATIRYGLGQPPDQDRNGILMIRATNIDGGQILDNDMLRIRHSAIPLSRNPFLKSGDIIIVRSGVYTGDVGLVTPKFEGAVAGYDLIVSPSRRQIQSSLPTTF